MPDCGMGEATDHAAQEITRRADDLRNRELLTERQARSRAFAEVWLKRKKGGKRW